MKRRPSTALSLSLSLVLALGMLPAPALAQMAEETMVAEPVAADPDARAAGVPAPTPQAAEGEMGEGTSAPDSTTQVAPDVAPEHEYVPEGDAPETATDGNEQTLSTQSIASGTWGSCPWEIDENGKLTIRPGMGEGTVSHYPRSSPWSAHASKIISVECKEEDGQKVVFPWDSSDLFYELGYVSSMDLSGADTSAVRRMTSMFEGCSSLASVGDLSGWDTSNVTDMYCMFKGCSSLASVGDLSGWDTSNVTRMIAMFSGCSSLASVGDLSGWDTSAVTHMDDMFSDCSSLASLDLSGWDTSNVTDMSCMFEGCSSLASLDLSGWDTSAVTYMVYMFSGCSSLASLDLSGWDTSKVWVKGVDGVDGFTRMFSNCTELASITVGEKYAMQGADMFPAATAANGKWWSDAAQTWFTKDQIVSSRSGVADTYRSSNEFEAAGAFPDVRTDAWYAGVVGRAVTYGLLGGYENGNFGPDDPITRGQVAVVLWKMAGQPDEGARDFPDVRSGEYYYQAVRWAGSKGIVSGYGNGNFGPNDKVTREQLAVMLANYARDATGRQLSGSASDYAGMSDRGSVSDWAQSSVGWCCRYGILNGSGGQLRPQGNASRAEACKMVVFLHDMLG